MRCLFLGAVLLLLYSCTKTHEALPANPALPLTDTTGFIKYTIRAGDHFTAQNRFKPVATDTLRFRVRFDSTAVYKSAVAQNQYDINKLYGFSDNNSDHHQYSARFGWRWSDGALRLFAYVYNEGKVVSEELGIVPIGAAVACRIVVTAQAYLFYCNDREKTLPRKSTTPHGTGYLLYPYFGGDEPAPHDVTIWIKKE